MSNTLSKNWIGGTKKNTKDCWNLYCMSQGHPTKPLPAHYHESGWSSDVCKGALPSTKASATSENEPTPETWTEMRKETRAIFLFLFLSHLLLLVKGFLPPSHILLEHREFLSDLRQWHIHELLRSSHMRARHLMSAQRWWIKVRTQFRPRVRTYLRTFPSGKSAKKPLPSLICSTNVRWRSCWTLSWARALKAFPARNWNVNGLLDVKRCWILSWE